MNTYFPSPVSPTISTKGPVALFKLNPALYFVRLFMNLLLWCTLSFFALHTVLWFIRAKKEESAAEEGKHE